MFEFCGVLLNGFKMRRLTDDQVIARWHYDELTRRFRNGLNPNSNLVKDVPLFCSAIDRLRARNFDRMCPIICLFFTHGLDFKPMKRMKLNAFI